MPKSLSLSRTLVVALLAAVVASVAAAASGAPSGASRSASATATAPRPATKAQWAKIVAAAKREGEATIYSSQNPLYLADFAARVKDKYGIILKVNRQIDSVLAQQLNAEYAANKPEADIFVTATKATALGAQKPQNRWAADAVGPALFARGFNRTLFAKPAKAAVVGSAIVGMAWNTNQWREGLNDLPGVLNTRLKGRVGMIAPSAFSIIDWYKWVEENYGANFLERLAAQEPKIYTSSLPMTQAVAAGEISVGTFIAGSARDLKTQGAPIEFKVPQGKKTGTWNAPWYGMVLRRAPHRNAAQVVFNFIMTREGQALISKHSGSPLKGVPNTFYVTPRQQNLRESTPAKVAEFQKRWDALFRR